MSHFGLLSRQNCFCRQKCACYKRRPIITTPSTLTALKTGTLESPCSPIMLPWQLEGAIPSFWLISTRKREESRAQPLLTTRSLGERWYATLRTSRRRRDWKTTSRRQSGLYFASCGMINLKISTFFCTSASRLPSPRRGGGGTWVFRGGGGGAYVRYQN